MTNIDEQLIGEYAYARVIERFGTNINWMNNAENISKFCDDIMKGLLFTAPELFNHKLTNILQGFRTNPDIAKNVQGRTDVCSDCVSVILLLKQLDDQDNNLAVKQPINWEEYETSMTNKEYLKIVFRLKTWNEVISAS
jgi:hypothetical protein